MSDWLQRILARAKVISMPKIGAEIAIQRWPCVDGHCTIDGLAESVEIIRDHCGIPHIYAKNENDLFFAQGYVHAQDRLWQMEMNRRIGQGRMSEVVGAEALALDRLMRTIGLSRMAERSWTQVHEDARRIVEAYVAGINAWIKNAKMLAFEFTLLGVVPEPWSPVDILLRGNVLALNLAGNHRLELLRTRLLAEVGEALTAQLLTPCAPESPEIVSTKTPAENPWKGLAKLDELDRIDEWLGDPHIVSGSNNWVVHGSRTASGKPLLANDIHIALGVPSAWYANGLHGGRFDEIGYSLAGVPLILLGHNGQVAWGMSNLNPDTQDFYVEKLDSLENPRHYEYRGQWLPLEITRNTISVRGGPSVEFEVRSTCHGPIMNEAMSQLLRNAEPLALRWAHANCIPLIESLAAFNSAKDLREFRAALTLWESPGQNFVFADIHGNIAYQATGKIPIRAPGHDGLSPIPGWTGAFEWQGFIAFDELPTAMNPECGFIATANNKVTADDYPYSIARHWFPGYRAKRIMDRLQADTPHTVEKMRQIQLDTYSLPAEVLRPYLRHVVPSTEREIAAFHAVKSWNLRFDVDSIGATVFEAWYITLLRQLLAHKLDADTIRRYLASDYERHGSLHMPMVIAAMQDPQSNWFVDAKTGRRWTRESVVQQCFESAVAWLTERYGADTQQWTWGRVHQITLTHTPFGQHWPDWMQDIFNTKRRPAPGNNYTINGASFIWKDPFDVVHGTALRMIVDLGNVENSIGIHLPGQSEHLHHPHRDDLSSRSLQGSYYPLLYRRQSVDANKASVLTLAPPQRP